MERGPIPRPGPFHTASHINDGELNIDELKLTLLDLFRSPTYKPPILPVVAVELLALSRKPRVAASDIAKLLSRDPMLAGQLLRIAQSAVYARREPIRSLDDAIVRLGLQRVSDLFVQASLEMRVFRAPGYDSEMESLRKHSAFVAEATRLASRYAHGLLEYGFICGLLHDVGIAACILALAELGKTGNQVSFEKAWPSIEAIHESASELMARIWGLPNDIALVLRLHHTIVLDGHVHPLAATVALADGLAGEVGYGFHGETDSVHTEAAAQLLGLHPAGLSELRSAVAELANRCRAE